MQGADEVTYRKIREHVERIAASESFAASERLCRFLRFTVESKLSGRGDQVKEYVLGREVFDRGPEYDTRLDPIVRVEAQRLRSRLAQYYGGAGLGDSLRLEYPKGSYLPTVREVATQPSARRLGIWVPAIVLGVAVIIAAVLLLRPNTDPMIAPLPDRWIARDDGTLDASDVALAEAVDERLANDPGMRVVAWPEILSKKIAPGIPLADIASRMHAGRSLVLVVRDDAHSIRRVRVFAIDEPSGQKRLALSYPDASLTPYAQDALAVRIVADLERLSKPQ